MRVVHRRQVIGHCFSSRYTCNARVTDTRDLQTRSQATIGNTIHGWVIGFSDQSSQRISQ